MAMINQPITLAKVITTIPCWPSQPKWSVLEPHDPVGGVETVELGADGEDETNPKEHSLAGATRYQPGGRSFISGSSGLIGPCSIPADEAGGRKSDRGADSAPRLGVGGHVGLHEPGLIDAGIDLRGGEGGVAEQGLDCAQVAAGLE
jgi:hypothetical protein